MLKLINLSFLFLAFNSLSQEITVVDRTRFKIDSLEFSISKIKYLRRTEVPFIRGGDAKYARSSQIFFKLKNSASLSVSIGDSLFVESMVSFTKGMTEYYLFSDTVTKSEGRLIYNYRYTVDFLKNEDYHLVVSPISIRNRKYFALITVDTKNLPYAFRLIHDFSLL
ncbi:MAG: hypothetical protein ACO1N0_14785 [Fluviicola sp.]